MGYNKATQPLRACVYLSVSKSINEKTYAITVVAQAGNLQAFTTENHIHYIHVLMPWHFVVKGCLCELDFTHENSKISEIIL